MTLVEAILKPFLGRKQPQKTDEKIPEEKEISKIYDALDPDVIATGFFDNSGFTLNQPDKYSALKKQAEIINTYRNIASGAEVDEAISIIVNEATFNPETQFDSVYLDFDQNTKIPQNLQEKITEEFDDILNKLELDKNFYHLFYTYYVDGQLNLYLGYPDKNKENGFNSISLIDPINLYYDNTSSQWKYLEVDKNASYGNKATENLIFDKEEIVHINSGLFSGKLILSNLHKAIRPANLLKTSEDMLIPMRFSRSMSRRVFNVDVANLPENKVKQLMETYKNTYKYSNFFNVEEGTISKQIHTNSLVEDYWFPNRGGAKGTTVDTIDETGNLGEITDIQYFKQKLYKALKVPTSRISDSEATPEFDFSATSISQDELKFFSFISRIRAQFAELFYELMRRQLIYKGILKEEEWFTAKRDLTVVFRNQNIFYEKLEQEKITSRTNIFNTIKEDIGKIYSWEFALKKVLKMTDEEIRTQQEAIKKEKTDPIWKDFFQKEEEGY